MRGPCDNASKSIREEVLEEQFLQLLKDIKMDKRKLDWVIGELRQNHDKEKAHHRQTIQDLNKKIETLQDRLNKAYEDKLDGMIPEEFWEEKFKTWTEKKQKLTTDLLF